MSMMSIASKVTAAALVATLAIPLTQLGEADAGGRDRPIALTLMSTAKGAIEAIRSSVVTGRDTISIDH